MKFEIKKYSDEYKNMWDQFVENKSRNGTFLQTRRFIEYHPAERFEDSSIMIFKGNELIAIVLACRIIEDNRQIFYSHKGSTYGGIIISDHVYKTTILEQLVLEFEEWCRRNNFDSIVLKMTPSILCNKKMELFDYFMYKLDYSQNSELNFYLPLEKYKEDILVNFTSGKRRDYRYSIKNNLLFKKLDFDNEVKNYYFILNENLTQLGLTCIHTCDELLEFKNERIKDEVEFYGVFYRNEMIAGSMIFIFNYKIMHTQYLSSLEKYRNLYSMDFLIYNLIQEAVKKHMEYLTFGICTENKGKYLNMGLSRFKEGFGADYCLNLTYEKKIN